MPPAQRARVRKLAAGWKRAQKARAKLLKLGMREQRQCDSHHAWILRGAFDSGKKARPLGLKATIINSPCTGAGQGQRRR